MRVERSRWWREMTMCSVALVAAVCWTGVVAQAAPMSGPRLGSDPGARGPRWLPNEQSSPPGAAELNAGRDLMLRRRWEEAIRHFDTLLEEHADSGVADDAAYFKARCLFQLGRDRETVELVNHLLERYPESPLGGDAEVLRIEAAQRLVRGGETSYSRYLRDAATPASGGQRPAADPAAAEAPAAQGAPQAADSELRWYALSALASMGAEEAWPLVQRIFTESDDVELRRKAVWVLSQLGQQPDAFDLLVELARNDADEEVRRQALFWVAQSGGNDNVVVELLRAVAFGEGPLELRKHAVYSLTQLDDEGAIQALDDLARDPTQPLELRGDALFWLGQRGEESLGILREILDGDADVELKNKALFGVSQIQGQAASNILLDVARSDAPDEMKNTAIFWIGQRDDVRSVELLIELWDGVSGVEVKKSLLFALSQTGSEAAVDKLIEVAKDSQEDTELRKSAVFWLGEVDSPKARQALAEIIGGSPEDL